MNRNIFRLLLSAVLMMYCTAVGAVGTQPSVGDGSSTNPYQIATKDNLLWFANHVNSGNASACAKLTADITVNTGVLDSNGSVNSGTFTSWTPIGGQENSYSGEFNGNGHTISGLYVNDASMDCAALFGKIGNTAYIHDLGVKDSYFRGNIWVAGICGDFASGKIENCWNGATVVGCHVSTCAGGIAGSCWKNASVNGCYNIGKVSVESGCSDSQCGGICGIVAKNTSVTYSVSNCVSLEGKCVKAYNVYTQDSDYTGIPNESYETIGNAVIDNDNVTIQDASAFTSGEVCWRLNGNKRSTTWRQQIGKDSFPILTGDYLVYYDNDNGDYLNESMCDKTDNHLHTFESKYSTIKYWHCTACRNDYQFYDRVNELPGTERTQPTGTGTKASPYQIATLENLLWFADYVNDNVQHASACAKLTADITMNASVIDSDGRSNGEDFFAWTPIGGQNGRDYSGEFDGDGHTISGLYFKDTNTNNVGLFGKAVGEAHIHDLGIKDSYFYGKDHVGGICGDFASGRIENCWNGATVYAKDWNAGGISGSCYINASIKDCYNIGTIIPCNNNNPSYGGICGAVYENTGVDYTISNCHTLEGKCDKGVYGSLDGGCPASEINNSFVKNATAFASGEVCYLLNHGVTDGSQKWYQTLNGTDNFPVIDKSHGTVYCGYHGDVLKYSNTKPDAPAHIVSYVDADGQEKTAVAVKITNGTSTLNTGWYVVTGEVSRGNITCNGAVHLILADGTKLTASGGTYQAGITVSGEGNSLAIYGQTAQSGQLIAKGGNGGAGIGGGLSGSGSNITINGGTVTAGGGFNGAGIGGGHQGSGSNITINGGTVTATGGQYAAGIGGGSYGSGSNITINGGTVTANAGGNQYNQYIYCSSIGGGYTNNGSSSSKIFVATELTIRADNSNPPATVVAADRTAETDIADLLKGRRYATVRLPQPSMVTYGNFISVSPEFVSGDRVDNGIEITFTAVDRRADNYEFLGFYKESTFENKITQGVSGQTYTVTVLYDDISVYAKYKEFIQTSYIDTNGQEQSVKAAEITNETSTLNAGWYVVTGADVRTGTLTCNGAVNLILADGAKLTATGGDNQAGIAVSGDGNSLTIYGQAAQSGQLIAKGGAHGAGIGGGYTSSSNITINGGKVTAKGGDQGAGIGGGDRGDGYNIIINGGEVTATGGTDGAGIGGGLSGSGSNITINGGTVTATGGAGAAGIGGGNLGSGSNITINGGTVTATGGDYAAGIGGGREKSGSNITINGGTVTTTGGNYAAGIGGGYNGSGSNITINGGTVTTTGGSSGASIGGGYQGSGSNIKVAAVLTIYAGNMNPPIVVISHTDNDIAPCTAVFRYAIVKDDITGIKESAIAAINAAIEGVTNEDIIAIATNAIAAINAAINQHEIKALKEQALAAIVSAKAACNSALDALGTLGTEQSGPAVEVIDQNDKGIMLYNPKKVNFIKVQTEE